MNDANDFTRIAMFYALRATGGDYQESQDVAQDAWIRSLEHSGASIRTLVRWTAATRRRERRTALARDLAGEAVTFDSGEIAPLSWGVSLNERQTEVATLLARGLTQAEVAERLNVAPQGVYRTVQQLSEKLGGK